MSSMNLKDLLRGFNEAVNETALAKSAFYKQIISEIKATISRKRPMLDHEGNPISYDIEITLIHPHTGEVIYRDVEKEITDPDGKTRKITIHEKATQIIKVPLMEDVSIDDMIAGIYSLGSRGAKINHVPNSFVKRISRGATYARILSSSGKYPQIARHGQELVRQDVGIVVKILLPDLSKVSMPAHQKLAENTRKSATSLDDLDLPTQFQ